MRPGSLGQPPVLERLTVSADADGLASVRMTECQHPSSRAFRPPAQALLSSYQLVMQEAGKLPPSASKEDSYRLAGRVQPLAEALAKAVPAEARQRVECASGLAVIELTVANESLEKYPWELITGPGGVGSAGNVVVYRRASSPSPPPKPKQWTGSVLLVGSEAMRSGSAYAREELDLITEALEDISAVTVHPEQHMTINALRGLLDRYRPAVFHLAAHGTRDDLRFQNSKGPTLEDLHISPEVLAAELESSSVQTALLSCCDSAAPPSSGGRPAARLIAEKVGAAVVGIAGKIQPYAAALFGQAFHVSLASGESTVEAYFQGIRAIKGHETYGLMWSMPVMYSRDANVIPFPSSNTTRARLTFQEAEQQLTILNGELANLVGMRDCAPEEWEKRAAVPTVRVRGITEYLPALPEVVPPTDTSRALERQRLETACEALSDWLQASDETLYQLGSPDDRERRQARMDLRLRRLQLERVLMNLRYAFDDIA